MKFLFCTFLFALPLFCLAQTNEGIATYQITAKLEINLDDTNPALMKNMPTSNTMYAELLFTPTESLYHLTAGNQGMETSAEEDGVQFRMQIRVPQDEIYHNLETGERTELRDFMDRKFIINSTPDPLPWKISGEQKQIQGYLCQKAELQDTSRTVVAWFSPQIPVATGPSRYNQLPGLILEVDIDNGKQVITASKIEFKTLEPGSIQRPEKGKKVTQEEFDNIVEEKRKEMGASGTGGNMIIIRRQ